MEKVLQRLTWKTCLVYLDDNVVLGKTVDEHCGNLKEVFQILRAANLKLSPKKNIFFRKEVQYLGHIVSSKGIHSILS